MKNLGYAYAFDTQRLHSDDIEYFLYEEYIDESGNKQRRIKENIVNLITEEDLRLLLTCIKLINSDSIKDNDKIVAQRKAQLVMNDYNLKLNTKKDAFGEQGLKYRK